MHTAKNFFGRDKMTFDLVKAPGSADVRPYKRFTDVIDDTIDARIWLGIHFRAPDVQGAELGENVADWVNEHEFESQ